MDTKLPQSSPIAKGRLLFQLFLSTFYLSAFTFGGGYVIVTLMKKKFVDQFHWIDQQEMLDLVAIAQSAPGAIAVNGAIVVGYKLAGLIGVITSVTATVLPPFLILSLISFCYSAFRSNLLISWMLKGMQSGVAAVIMVVVWEMSYSYLKEKQWLPLLLMAAAFFSNLFLGISTILLILIFAFLGAMHAWYLLYKNSKKGGR